MSGNATFYIRKNPTQITVWINQIGLTIRESTETGHGQRRSVQFADAAPGIGKHVKVQTFGRAELGIALRWIYRDTNDLGIQFSVIVNISLERPRFQSATCYMSKHSKIR
jgi:hypothetical protein